ncbi:MAG: hypothetical protein MN733_21045, partial [Nitrososphaera sp.]|nr:hypothetical protein [Nitrososphaera sp.]
MHSNSKNKWSLLSRFFAISAIPVAILDGAFWSLGGQLTDYGMILAITLSVATLVVAIRYLATNGIRTFGLLLALYVGQLGIFVYQLAGTELQLSFRLLQVAITLTYLATVLAVLLGSVGVIRPENAILLSVSMAVALFLGEAGLELWASSQNNNSAPQGVEWAGVMTSFPDGLVVYAPYSEIRGYYPDNPRGYFKEEDIVQSKWKLQSLEGNVANLSHPAEKPDTVRVDIYRTVTDIGWHIQLRQARLNVRAKQPYRVSFQARADRPREITLGFNMGHEPWKNLGLRKI